MYLFLSWISRLYWVVTTRKFKRQNIRKVPKEKCIRNCLRVKTLLFLADEGETVDMKKIEEFQLKQKV